MKYTTFDYFMNHMKRFANSNGLVIMYNMNFKDNIETIRLKSCDPINWVDYTIDWTEVDGPDDVQEAIKAITDDARKVFNIKQEKKKTPSINPRPESKTTYEFKRQDTPLKNANLPEIKKVIFNNPATIVFWADGTKTVVKCHKSDVYSREAGLAWCISKKVLGNNDAYIDIFNKWIPNEKESDAVKQVSDMYSRCSGCKFTHVSWLKEPCLSCALLESKWQAR